MNNNFKILIVEDNPGLRESLDDIFTANDYIVEAASTGAEAVDLCAKNEYITKPIDFNYLETTLLVDLIMRKK